MTPGDLVVYRTVNGGVRLVQFLRYLSARRAVIRLDGQERSVFVRSLREIECV